MDYEEMRTFQLREEGKLGEGEPTPLVFTGEDMARWDEEDFGAAGLAMERNKGEREDYWRERALRAEGAFDVESE